MNWTPEQKDVIWSRNGNLLVSAAAGSGKTAVLVERIIQMVTDEEHPIDIDQLLVMTFTKAAAAEMRERIALAIGTCLKEQPDNLHLQMQSTLVHNAQITTIDSFCLNLIRDHFNMLEIDPDFRIGEEGELMLLRQDVLEEMLEEYYEKGDARFEQFVDTYAAGKADGGIQDYIMQVYTFAQSNPWPELWLENCRTEQKELMEGQFGETAWMKFLMEDVKKQTGELCGQLEEAMAVCMEEGGPEVYLPVLETELAMLKELHLAGDYRQLNQSLKAASFGRLAAARSKDLDADKKAYVTGCRDRIKKAVAGLKEDYGFEDPEEMEKDLLKSREAVDILLELSGEFAARYRQRKQEKNIVDFNDLEHYALDILVKYEDGKLCYTETADELSAQYAEILVDEYQDSNYVQETLINSLSGERFGRPDVFMVGDVKQSIYRFRLARPEIFMEKYETYSEEESSCRKIELHQNFRSRETVLNSINDVFYRIMTRNLGNIQYTEAAALHPGAVFAPVEQEETQGSRQAESQSGQQAEVQSGGQAEVQSSRRAGTPTELLLVNTGRESSRRAEEEMEEYTSREIEAKMIAKRIRELTDREQGLLVWDKEENGYRTAEYRDMVILLRSVSGWTDAFLNVLTREGIPAYADTGTGYFNTVEVETMLSVLAVIDNPIQDIPLTAVLKSPIVGLTDEELAFMMAAYKKAPDKGQDRGVYGAWNYWISMDHETEVMEIHPEGTRPEVTRPEETRPEITRPEVTRPEETRSETLAIGEEMSGIQKKLKGFHIFLARMRTAASYLPIHEVIYRVFVETGYYDYVSAMPGGEARRANLDMLAEKASVYEKTSYRGLFHFIRYIEKLKKYDTDFGEATAGDGENMVRLMSIHKSTGLEFPIVFLAGMGKPFNKQDVRGKILIDADLGIATDYFDQQLRLKSTTLKKNVLKRKMEIDSLGEELRVLYVGMTRAKEKLIMTATDRYLERKAEKWSRIPADCRALPYTVLMGAGSYLDWIFMALPGAGDHILSREMNLEDLVGEEVYRQAEKHVSKEMLLEMDLTETGEETYLDALKEAFEFQYPYQAAVTLNAKMSVSEIKKLGQDADEWENPYQAAVPLFLKEKTPSVEKSGAGRGTAYHRVLELLDFSAINDKPGLIKQMRALLEEKRMAAKDWEMLEPDVLWEFLCSPLGQRMKAAQAAGRCHKEQQFVMGIPASEMGVGETGELVLVQGIIDAYLEEEDGLILIDYKTDHIFPGQEDYLVKRYGRQLEYYQRALEQMTGKIVLERLIYSLTLQKCIPV